MRACLAALCFMNTIWRWFTTWPDRLPSACPLCWMPAVGGHLCEGCEAEFFWGRQQRAICQRCASDLSVRGHCHACSRQWPLSAVISALDYAFAGQMLIRRYKQQGQLALARLLARLMVTALDRQRLVHRPAVWVPIPASHQRLCQTGFSPAQQLARQVALRTHTVCQPHWMSQVDPVTPQKHLDRAQRELAVQDRFTAGGLPPDCVVGLVDDVMTTGSTLVAAAHALRLAGASDVVALVAARTPTLL